ncbi:MAG: hypothetical protein FWD61_06845 [Phycisphaerales bacterium]|nr:hypothetical protein [Phycisphaerales bacterium]
MGSGFNSTEFLQGMQGVVGGGRAARKGLHLGAAAGAAANRGSSGSVSGAFARAFDTKLKGNLSAAELARRTKAEQAAGDLTANALILPMLKQLRRSPWGKNSVFSGGIGEKTFGPEFDRQIADRLAQSPKMGIKTALANRLINRNAASQTNITNPTKLDVHG